MGVLVAVGVPVAVPVGVTVRVDVVVAVAVLVGVSVGVLVGVTVGVSVGVAVRVTVGVDVNVAVGSRVTVGVLQDIETIVPLELADKGKCWPLKNMPSSGVVISKAAVTRTLMLVPEQELMDWVISTDAWLVSDKSIGLEEADRVRASTPAVSCGL